MTNLELDDSLDALENKATAHRIPLGWHFLHAGLIAWGIYYLLAFSPWFSGWTQEEQLKGGTALEVSVTSTIAYTAIPATVLALLAWGMARRRKTAAK
jgi:choline-glycine betaine transporter